MNYPKGYYDTSPVKRRNKELIEMFLEAYRLMRKKNLHNAKAKAIQWVVYNGRPRYHVGYIRTHIALCVMAQGGKPCKEGTTTFLMWQEIDARVRAMQHALGISRAKAIDFVLEYCRASRFFIKEHTAHLIINDWLKTHKNRY